MVVCFQSLEFWFGQLIEWWLEDIRRPNPVNKPVFLAEGGRSNRIPSMRPGGVVVADLRLDFDPWQRLVIECQGHTGDVLAGAGWIHQAQCSAGHVRPV